jgi:DNA-binding NarL/FixJ family response regulator
LAGLSAGGNDYITKPYDIDEFRMRVLSFLRLVGSAKMQNAQETPAASVLTEKELSVALFAAQGFSNKEIADKVFLSESRIKTCLTDIYSKLGISDKDNKRELLTDILNK